MTMMAQAEIVGVVVGVDTHKDTHVAHAKDRLGRSLGDEQVPATVAGYRQLLRWARDFGGEIVFGVEGPGHYGAGLCRFLRAEGVEVREVGRPNRQRRSRVGKSDRLDATAAALAVVAGEDLGVPKSADGTVEMLRMLRSTRSTAVRAKTAAVVSLQALIVTAPVELRERFAGLSARRLVRVCARLELPAALDTPTDAAVLALGILARRYETLEVEAKLLEAQIRALASQACPTLLAAKGVGPDTAATLLVAFGDNAERLDTEAAFAKLCGVAPQEASSGRSSGRHRLSRSGNRQANRALHTVVVVRLRSHPPTLAYVERRTAEGKTKKEIMRCLKRYVARELYTTICQWPSQCPRWWPAKVPTSWGSGGGGRAATPLGFGFSHAVAL